MHDTAIQIGAKALKVYAPTAGARILDVGSYDVNGTLRDHADPTWQYVGVDIEAGPGVDLVIKPNDVLPFADGSFDLVVATSVFEHDSMFWATFLEMVRVTAQGGFIYVNCPSNGEVHRYPVDNWRFYPDSGEALAIWARKQGFDVELIESFIANRSNDIWNDFVAVWRKGPTSDPLPSSFLYPTVAAYNVRTWQTEELLNPRSDPEDVVLLKEMRERAARGEAEVSELRRRIEELNSIGEERDRLVASSVEIQQQLARVSSELAQRNEEIWQTRTDLKELNVKLATTEHLLEQRMSELSEANFRASEAQDQVTKFIDQAKRSSETIDQLVAALSNAVSKVEIAQRERGAAISEAESFRQQIDRLEADLESQRKLSETARDSLQAELDNERSQAKKLSHSLQAELDNERSQAKKRSDSLQAELDNERRQAKKIADSLQAAIELHRTEASICEKSLRAHVVELELEAGNRGERLDRYEALSTWLRRVAYVRTQMPFWAQLGPKTVRRRFLFSRLKDAGLFDAEAYLSANPDVAEQGVDPLEHYLVYGIDELRDF